MSRAATRPSFLLRLRPEPHVDGIRALRRLLKTSLRSFGLRAVEIREDTATLVAMDHPEAWRSPGCDHRRRMKGQDMDMREYAGSNFIRVDDVRAKPWRGRVRNIKTGQFGRPVAEFDSGKMFTINATNVKILIQAYGLDSRDWLGVEIELYAGTTKYNGEDQESVLVRPISIPKQGTAATEPLPRTPPRDDMGGDTIPF